QAAPVTTFRATGRSGMSLCFDVGANIGAYSVQLSKRCSPGGTVHSFEPVYHIRQKLHLNLAVNGARNVTVNDFALGDQDALLEMHQVKEGVFRAGTSSFVKNATIQAMGNDKFVVDVAKTRTLDGYVAEMGFQRIDFIKIDVEGFEFNVLRGGIKSIRQFRPAIILEFEFDRHGDLSNKFVEFFAGLNYGVFHCWSIGRNLVVEPFDFSFQPKERNVLCLPAG
ncbi:MAG: FkbM family methyltransferase, partial [Rhodospirillales bacterium]